MAKSVSFDENKFPFTRIFLLPISYIRQILLHTLQFGFYQLQHLPCLRQIHVTSSGTSSDSVQHLQSLATPTFPGPE